MSVSMKDVPNVLVLSAGGHGHVPLPLLKQTEPLVQPPPIAKRRYFALLGPSDRYGPDDQMCFAGAGCGPSKQDWHVLIL